MITYSFKFIRVVAVSREPAVYFVVFVFVCVHPLPIFVRGVVAVRLVSETNQFLFVFVFSGFLLPYVCWHCNIRGSTWAVISTDPFKLRWPCPQQSNSRNLACWLFQQFQFRAYSFDKRVNYFKGAMSCYF